MTSYNIQTMICKKCEKLFGHWALRSHNTIGASFYTDGSISGPMYSQFGRLISCPYCDGIFWPDEMDVIEEVQDYKFFKDKKWSKIESSFWVSYMAAVEEKVWRNLEEEKTVRIRAWHQFNLNASKNINSGGAEEGKGSWDHHSNLNALIKLLDDRSDEERLMKAEANRNTGDFDAATSLLENHRVRPEFEGSRKLILALAYKRDTLTRSLNYEVT